MCTLSQTALHHQGKWLSFHVKANEKGWSYDRGQRAWEYLLSRTTRGS